MWELALCHDFCTGFDAICFAGTMKTACVLVILALAAVGSADRSLLAPARAPAPAPAPGPSANCPPKQSPACESP